ncbi:hypothetical protein R6242_20120 [Iodobacter sp. CM08]|uniref:hypothetical protein n=1 Tax=Iodobacter sp. CM08 TaxID=3085902 RepID=UPI002980CEF1|nr:hypothetical protein [Iodobacter sp. CM08]MDW5418881.1 hypothetical protein [Iodobacter sp. CM08]
MDKALVTSLALAFISGITFLAYKHPIAFKRIYIPLCYLFSVLSFTAFAWNSAIVTVLSTLKAFIPTAQSSAAATKAHELDFPAWHSWVLLCFIIYMVFLLWLPNLLADDKDK